MLQGAAMCALVTGLLTLIVHGVAVLTGLLVGAMYGVVLALSHSQPPSAPSLELVIRSTGGSNLTAPLFLFSRYPESNAECRLIGRLQAVCDTMPPPEFFEKFFAGLPKQTKLGGQASQVQAIATSLIANIRVEDWYRSMEQLDFETPIRKLLELTLQACNLHASSVTVFNLLQESLSPIIGETVGPQELIGRLQFLRIRCHPDQFCHASASFAEANGRLKQRADSVFKALGQLLDLVRKDQDFAKRLCLEPTTKSHWMARQVKSFWTGIVGG
jgi:hypothetical protein